MAAGAAQFQNSVRRHRRAVEQLAHVGAAEPGFAEELAHAVHDRAGVVVHARRDLLRVDAARGIEQHDVGERAADVDPDAKARGHRQVARSASGFAGALRAVGVSGAISGPLTQTVDAFDRSLSRLREEGALA